MSTSENLGNNSIKAIKYENDRLFGEITGKKPEGKTDYKLHGQYQGHEIIGINKETKQLNVKGLGVDSY